MKTSFKLLACVSCASVLLSIPFVSGCTQTQQSPQQSTQSSAQATTAPQEDVELIVYAGAALKHASEDLISGFNSVHPHTKLNITFNGSGKLLAQLQSSHTGDVFIVGSKADYEKAQQEGLVSGGVQVAAHIPTIVVKQGNPKKITGLSDLKNPDIKLILCDPDSASIGKTAHKIFEKNNLLDAENNVVSRVGAVPEIVTAVASGNADAGICTADSVFNAEGVQNVPIPRDQNIEQHINASLVNFSAHPKQAQEFIDFLTSAQGQEILKKHGFVGE